LARKLDRAIKPSESILYNEAASRIRELRATTELLKRLKIQLVLGEIQKYSGTTVNDLRKFMQKNALSFDAAGTTAERELFPRLYAALVEQRERVVGPPKEPTK